VDKIGIAILSQLIHSSSHASSGVDKQGSSKEEVV